MALLATAARAQAAAQDVHVFRSCVESKALNGSIMASYPGSAGYSVLQTHNAQLLASGRMPIAFLQPTTSAAVAAAVRCANAAGLAWTARNGGHSYE